MNTPKSNKERSISVEKVNLERFEELAYFRKYEEAGRELLHIITRLRSGGGFSGHRLDDETAPRLYSRLAAAITALLTDPGFRLSSPGFELLATEHGTLDAVFQASTFGNSDHLLRHFGQTTDSDPTKLRFTNEHDIRKVLIAYSLDSEFELNLEDTFKAAPQLTLPCFLGMLAQHVVCSPLADRRRAQLLKLGYVFEDVGVRAHMLTALTDAYMYCSYATVETKHEVKRSFNKMSRRLIESSSQLPKFSAERQLKERPTILVLVEWFTSVHAMYRCYAPSIRQLRERFRLVMIGRTTEIDEVSKQLFDEVIELKSKVALREVIERICQVKPDIIFYPSIGMAPWWVALSAVRLAPIQVASAGHPATTNSEAIDYMLLDGLWPGDPSCFSETVIVLHPGSTAFVMRSDAEFPEPQIRESPTVLRVAVPSMVSKLNALFLQTCQSIARQASRPIEVHFFPHMVGLISYQASQQIRRWLPNAIVHSRCHYNEYLRNMAQCDVHLSTFPFGGTNSNIDSMRLCIPMVTLEGLEVHGQTDAGMMRRVGLPEWLITYHPAEYERAALRLIEQDFERVAIARALQHINVFALFMNESANVPQQEFLRGMTFIYENHEAIQASGRRYWSPADREMFCAARGPRPGEWSAAP